MYELRLKTRLMLIRPHRELFEAFTSIVRMMRSASATAYRLCAKRAGGDARRKSTPGHGRATGNSLVRQHGLGNSRAEENGKRRSLGDLLRAGVP